MSMPSLGQSPTRYDLEIPDGWTGIEHPRQGTEFEIVVDEPVGYSSRLSIERCRILTDSPDAESGPMERLIGERISSLAETTTDSRFIDLVLHRPTSDGGLPAFRATVAYRHGPSLVTAFIWALPLDDGGALVLTGLTDADMIALDAGVFEGIVESLRFGSDAEQVADADRPPVVVEAPARDRRLPAPPLGWSDVDPDDPRILRQLVADGPSAHPALISVLAAPDGLAGDAVERHGSIVDDLRSTMTDAELLDVASDELAVGAALRSLVMFRQVERVLSVDVWTGEEDPSQPVVWAICDDEDDAVRDAAIAWIRGASLEDLGAA